VSPAGDRKRSLGCPRQSPVWVNADNRNANLDVVPAIGGDNNRTPPTGRQLDAGNAPAMHDIHRGILRAVHHKNDCLGDETPHTCALGSLHPVTPTPRRRNNGEE